MSLTTELEELLKEKAQLQKILQSIEEEEKYQEERLRIFEEKIAIQALKEKIKAKQLVVEKLKSKKWNLEKGLQEPQEKPEISPATEEPKPKVAKAEEPQRKEPMEVMVSAAPAGNQQPKQYEEQQERQQEKQKRNSFVRCPYFSDPERKCNVMRKQVSNFDYIHYCNGDPVCCYYYRKAETQKTKTR